MPPRASSRANLVKGRGDTVASPIARLASTAPQCPPPPHLSIPESAEVRRGRFRVKLPQGRALLSQGS
jgi:hypothetical protein